MTMTALPVKTETKRQAARILVTKYNIFTSSCMVASAPKCFFVCLFFFLFFFFFSFFLFNQVFKEQNYSGEILLSILLLIAFI